MCSRSWAPDEARAALEALVAAGVRLDPEEGIRRGKDRGDAVGYFGLMRIDLSFNSIELHEQAAKRTRIVTLMGRPARILSPEDTVILKLFFNRGKGTVGAGGAVTASMASRVATSSSSSIRIVTS